MPGAVQDDLAADDLRPGAGRCLPAPYYHLHKVVDHAIGRILEALDDSGMADHTIVVFTSDHGDLVGAHSGLMQKWYNAFDEAIHVPLLVTGPGVAATTGGITTPTSHVDLVPTLLGLAGIDVERAADGVAQHHDEAQPLPGRDLSGIVTGKVAPESVVSPLYFMTEDDISRGLNQSQVLSGKPFDAVSHPSHVESVIATLPNGARRRGRAVGAQPLLRATRRVERSSRHPEGPVRGATRRHLVRAAQT